MSGVIDNAGQQWEHCNACSKWVKYEDLRYEAPSSEHPYGRDLCHRCEVLTRMKRLLVPRSLSASSLSNPAHSLEGESP